MRDVPHVTVADGLRRAGRVRSAVDPVVSALMRGHVAGLIVKPT